MTAGTFSLIRWGNFRSTSCGRRRAGTRGSFTARISICAWRGARVRGAAGGVRYDAGGAVAGLQGVRLRRAGGAVLRHHAGEDEPEGGLVAPATFGGDDRVRGPGHGISRADRRGDGQAARGK